MNQVWLAQALGVIAALIGLSAYLYQREGAFKRQIGFGSWVWGVHLGLLGAGSAMYTQFAIGTRSWCSIGPHSSRYQHGLFWISSAVFCALAVIGWDGWVSLLPLAAAINSTAAMVYGDNRQMRIRLLLSSALWISTGLYWNSWPMVVTELIAVTLNLRTILRLAR